MPTALLAPPTVTTEVDDYMEDYEPVEVPPTSVSVSEQTLLEGRKRAIDLLKKHRDFGDGGSEH